MYLNEIIISSVVNGKCNKTNKMKPQTENTLNDIY